MTNNTVQEETQTLLLQQKPLKHLPRLQLTLQKVPTMSALQEVALMQALLAKTSPILHRLMPPTGNCRWFLQELQLRKRSRTHVRIS